MKRILSLLLLAVLIIAAIPVNAVSTPENGRGIIYVSTDGDDSNDGSIENPLLTLQAARDKIRQMKQTGNYSKGYTVYVRGGTYNVSETFVLEEQDSGTAEAPITYRAYGNEKVVFSGGVTVSGKEFSKITDTAVLNRIIESSARDKIYMLDLKNYGITDVGETTLRGAYSYPQSFIEAGLLEKPSSAPASEILFNGKAMTLARYPNNDYMAVEAVVERGYNQSHKEWASIDTPFTIKVKEERLAKWTKAVDDGALLFGFWWYDWADQSIPVGAIDVENSTITGTIPSLWSTNAGRPFYIYNLIEELDVPGEYYLDTKDCILYLYPTEDISKSEVILTVLETPLFSFEGASYVNVRGINVTGSRSHAYSISGGSYIEISDCEISYTAKAAVAIGNTFHSGICNSYIHDVEEGVILEGGIYESLTPGYNYVENCEITRFSRLSATYSAAVVLAGVGNIVQYNEIHDAPHVAIEFSGNSNKILYNEIYNVVHSSDDAGALYGGLTWVSRGCEMKYNYFHDLSAHGETAAQGAGVAAIYCDGGQCETIMVGNVFENIVGRGIWINGGQDNISANNVFVNCTQGVYLNDIMLIDSLEPNHYPRLQAAPYCTNEVWQKAFPKLQKMLEMPESEKRIPYGNICANNVAYKTKLVNEMMERLGETSKYMDYSQNLETNTDPGFYDVRNDDYTIKADAKVFETLPDFKAVPFTRMGRLDSRAMNRIQDAKILVINSPKSYANGKEVLIDPDNQAVVPFIHNDVTYVPLRFIAEILDATVDFDETTGQVQISGSQISLTVPSNGTEAVKNGENITLSNSTMIVNERTMVPLREISELFDKQVFWHNSGFICVSDDGALFDEKGSDDELIKYIRNRLNIY